MKAYGDTLDDGKVQLSFTLPDKNNPKTKEAAKQYILQMGFSDCTISHTKTLSDGFTFFIAYATSSVDIDYDKVKAPPQLEFETMDFDSINLFIKEKIKRKVVVVGACTGTDAHTVGIDAIINIKGYNHHYGLERYPMIEAVNLGAQVSNAKLIDKAKEYNADCILVSQVVTQKKKHVENLTELIEILKADKLRDRYIVCIGGPGITHQLAVKLGFDAGFTKGCYAEDVATFIIKTIVQNK